MASFSVNQYWEERNMSGSSQSNRLNINRRSFVKSCTVACAAGALTMASSAKPAFAMPGSELYPQVKARIRLIFCHKPDTEATWPNVGYDYEGRKQELIGELKKSCPEVDFVPVSVLRQEDARAIVTSDHDIDGYLVYIIGIWTGVSRVFAESGKPTILVDDLYAGSGEFLVEFARARRQGLKVVGVSSTDFTDVVQAVKYLSTLKKLQASRVLDVTENQENALWGGASAQAFKEGFGTEIQLIRADEFNAAYEQASTELAAQCAQQWISTARKVVEPQKEEIIKSGKMYLAMADLMKKYSAQAIAVDCLGLFYGDKISAYPCLGFCQLNDNGLVGACESDLYSTLTMLILTYQTGKPGFISDPVIDTSRNQIIYAHCVAPTKVYGPQGTRNQFDIRDHSEDRKGAAIRSFMPLGEMTTTIQFRPEKKAVIMHQGVTVENVDEDKACRTKLAVEVKGDVYKLMNEWDQWGWHRVTFYGDHKRDVENLAQLLGFSVLMEA
jgi:hypothetical protein